MESNNPELVEEVQAFAKNIEQEESLITTERVKLDDPLFQAAKKLEHQVFLAAGYTDQGDGELVEFSDYDEASIFNVVLIGEKVVGVLREIHQNERGFKTLNDFDLFPESKALVESLDSDKVLEIGTVAVEAGSRGLTEVADRLYNSAYAASAQRGDTHWIASIDDDLLRVYRHMGVNFVDLGESKDYMGSPTTPVILDLRKEKDYFLAKNPFLYRKVALGEFD